MLFCSSGDSLLGCISPKSIAARSSALPARSLASPAFVSAALSRGIGSDTQKPFVIVIVAGLVSRLFHGFFVNPVLYEMVAKDEDVLQVEAYLDLSR